MKNDAAQNFIFIYSLWIVNVSISSSLNNRFPWACAELTWAFSPSGFRRLRFPIGVGHLIHITFKMNEDDECGKNLGC